jgi:hypothetical protein
MTDPAPALFAHLGLPETDIARKAFAFAKRATPEFILNHSIRSYVFARAHAARRGLRPGTDYDDELVFVSCILHDIGLSEQGNGDQRFEVDGADTAAAFLRAHGVEERRVAIAWDAIALHTTPDIANRKATEVALTRAGSSSTSSGPVARISRPVSPRNYTLCSRAPIWPTRSAMPCACRPWPSRRRPTH